MGIAPVQWPAENDNGDRNLRPLDGILIFGITYLVSTVAAVLLVNKMSLRANTAVSVAVLFVIAWVLLRLIVRRPLKCIRFHRVPPAVIGYSVLAAVSLMLPTMALEAMILKVVEIPEELIEALTEMIRARSLPELLYVWLIAALGGGLSEELVFRGILQNGLAGRLRGWAALLITAGVFALLHTIWRFPPAFILGLFLGYLYLRSGSLVPSVVAHVTVNSVVVGLVYLIEGTGAMRGPDWVMEDKPAPFWIVGLSIIIFIFAMLRLEHTLPARRPNGPSPGSPRDESATVLQ